MEETGQQERGDRITSTAASPSVSVSATGGRPADHTLTGKPFLPKDERIVSTNHSPDAVLTGPSGDVAHQLGSSYTGGPLTNVFPQEQTYFYGGYEDSAGNWDDYSRHVNSNNLHVLSPAMYNDTSSLLFHSPYGLDTQMAYGQFSPMASTLSPVMVDGQLYSPHQIPVSPPYFPQPVSPCVQHMTSSRPVSQTELVTARSSGLEGLGDNVLVGPGSGYFVNYGSFGGGNLSGESWSNQSNSERGSYLSPLTTPHGYPQPFGMLGPYEQNIGQISQQQRPSHGFRLVESSSARNYSHGSSYKSSNCDNVSTFQWGGNNRSRLTPDKVGRRGRDLDSNFISIGSHGISSDSNRGPRASKTQSKSTTTESSSSATSKNGAPVSGLHLDLYNKPDFGMNYENAKFFIIKSFSEDNVHKSIKYSVWASTLLGNRKLDAAYQEAKEMKGHCPVFLLFSVNASGQFCGVAEMVGPVDFESNADYWQQDRWNGRFPVRWHIIKDIPNSRFRHILLENNDNKPVTHSRDSQEVKLELGVEMLQIFKEHEAKMSILDDFNFYDEREKALQERKAMQRAIPKNASVTAASFNQLSDDFAEAVKLEDAKEVARTN